MVRNILLVVALCSFLFTKAQDEKAYLNNKMEALWKSSSEFKTPESVYFYKKLNIIFVSNINGNPLEKDKNGFLSKLSPDGKIIKLEWIKGLHAPKGIGIYKDRLFVTDIDRVAEIDIQSEKIVNFYNVPEAKFLNDIVIDVSGIIYISDTQTNTIFKLYNGVISKWFYSESMLKPNGLCISGEFLFIGTKEKIIKVDLKTKTYHDYILNTESIDGLIYFQENELIYSDWSGNVYITGLGRETEKLLDTTPQKINAADIGFDYDKKIIYVPTFFDNRVMAYKVKF